MKHYHFEFKITHIYFNTILNVKLHFRQSLVTRSFRNHSNMLNNYFLLFTMLKTIVAFFLIFLWKLYIYFPQTVRCEKGLKSNVLEFELCYRPQVSQRSEVIIRASFCFPWCFSAALHCTITPGLLLRSLCCPTVLLHWVSPRRLEVLLKHVVLL